MDKEVSLNNTVIAHKLCGAGNGGFFLVFSEINKIKIPYNKVKIGVNTIGVQGNIL